jgi:hypothetical protein
LVHEVAHCYHYSKSTATVAPWITEGYAEVLADRFRRAGLPPRAGQAVRAFPVVESQYRRFRPWDLFSVGHEEFLCYDSSKRLAFQVKAALVFRFFTMSASAPPICDL